MKKLIGRLLIQRKVKARKGAAKANTNSGINISVLNICNTMILTVS